MDIIKAAFPDTAAGAGQEARKTLHWRKDERMAGMVPVWEAPSQTQKETVAGELSLAGQAGQKMPPDASFESALAYAAGDLPPKPAAAGEEFGFADLIDMANPLQHIPLVGHLYREITGDEIKPIAQIIGGGIFGGPAGAAGALVNTVVEYETGEDIAGNIVTAALDGQTPRYRSEGLQHGAVEKSLGEAASGKTLETLPGTVLGFADLGHGGTEDIYERVPTAEGRTAGTVLRKRGGFTPPLPAREPIAGLNLAAMPAALAAPAGQKSAP